MNKYKLLDELTPVCYQVTSIVTQRSTYRILPYKVESYTNEPCYTKSQIEELLNELS